MTAEDRARWDARHAGAARPPDPHPPDVLRDRLDLLPVSGRALDLACGSGAHAVWFALRGFRVDAVDVSAEALRLAEELAARHGVAGSVRWVRHDLDEGIPADCAGPYDVIVCQRFRDPALYGPMVERLAPDGLLAVTVLSVVGGRPGPFRADPGELAGALSDLDLLVDIEGDGEASVLARRPAGPDPSGTG